MKHILTALLCAAVLAVFTGCATSQGDTRMRTAHTTDDGSEQAKTSWTLGIVDEGD